MFKVYRVNLPTLAVLFILTLLLVHSSGCSQKIRPPSAAQMVNAESFPLRKDQLLGVWLRKIDDMPGYEGYQFGNNGKVQLLNMFTIIGDHWQLINGNSMTIWSYSGTSSEIDESRYRISELRGPRLTLIPGNAELGYNEVYYRPELTRPTDRWIGRWTNKDSEYLDITPADRDYRVVIGSNTEIRVYRGQAIDEQIEFPDNGRLNIIRRLPSKEIEPKSSEGLENCLMIGDKGAYCRSILP